MSMAHSNSINFDSLLDRVLSEAKLQLSVQHNLEIAALSNDSKGYPDVETSSPARRELRLESLHSVADAAQEDRAPSKEPPSKDIMSFDTTGFEQHCLEVAAEKAATVTLRKEFKTAMEQQNGCQEWLRPIKPDAAARITWDIFISAIIALVGLAETTFLAIPEWEYNIYTDVWMWFVTAIFTLDLLLNFNTAIYVRGAGIVYKRLDIAQAYLRGWFAIDFISALPPPIITESVVITKLLKLGRLSRGIHLFRFGSIRRCDKMIFHYLERLEQRAGVPRVQITWISISIRLALYLLIEAHLGACISLGLTFNTRNWLLDGVPIHQLPPLTRYNEAYLIAIRTVTTGAFDVDGFWDILQAFSCILFYVQLALVITWFDRAVPESDIDEYGEFAKKRKRLEKYLRHHNVNSGVREEIDTRIAKASNYQGWNPAEVLRELAPSIRRKLYVELHAPFFGKLDFFEQQHVLSQDFGAELCTHIDAVFFAPLDKIAIAGTMLFRFHYLADGLALVTWDLSPSQKVQRTSTNSLLSSDSFFYGEKKEKKEDWNPGTHLFFEVLFAPSIDECTSMCTVEALEPCEVWLLSRHSFNQVVAGTYLYNCMKLVRSRVKLLEDLIPTHPRQAWVVDVSEDNDKRHYKTLRDIVHFGFPASLEATSSQARAEHSDGRPKLTRESVYMISARFNSAEMINNCKELKMALEYMDFPNIRLVDAGGGDQFGPMTVKYLSECDAMIGMITDDYAEKTSSSYCSYYELKHYLENRYGCGSSQVLKFFPIKLCSTWPPPSRGEEGAALCKVAFPQDLLWTIDLHNRPFAAKEVAEAIASSVGITDGIELGLTKPTSASMPLLSSLSISKAPELRDGALSPPASSSSNLSSSLSLVPMPTAIPGCALSY
jgi:hypothetical protein